MKPLSGLVGRRTLGLTPVASLPDYGTADIRSVLRTE